VSRLVDGEDDLEVIGSGANRDECMAMVTSVRADVVVTDIGATTGGPRASRWPRAASVPTGDRRGGVSRTPPRLCLALLEEVSAGRAYCLKAQGGARTSWRAANRAGANGGSVIDRRSLKRCVNTRAAGTRRHASER